MSMDPIRPSQASVLVETLRKLGKSKTASAAASADDQSQAGDAQLRHALRSELSSLAAGVDVEDDRALGSIQGAVLRCILKHEWGAAAADDPAFASIVSAVDEAIRQDPRLVEMVRKALRSLP
jgi:hypothetical protein